MIQNVIHLVGALPPIGAGTTSDYVTLASDLIKGALFQSRGTSFRWRSGSVSQGVDGGRGEGVGTERGVDRHLAWIGCRQAYIDKGVDKHVS